MSHTTTDHLHVLTRASAASAIGRLQTAAELWQRVVEHNPVNGNYWYHLAEARYGTDDHAGALTAYRRALAIGVWEPVSQTFALPADLHHRIARCHARLGDLEAARQALTSAVDLGLRNLDQIWTDENLADLRTEDWFAERFCPPELTDIARDDGWRTDLRRLADEIPRRSAYFASRVDRQRFDHTVDGIHRRIPELSDAEILVELMTLLGQLGDGHAGFIPTSGDTALQMALPVQFWLFQEGLFVTATAPEHRRLLGAQVLAFDGHPVDEVTAALDPLIARDNDHGPTQTAPQLMRRTPIMHAVGLAAAADAATLTVRLMDGTDSQVTVPADSPLPRLADPPCPPSWLYLPWEQPGEPPMYVRNLGVPYWFEHLPAERLTYFQFNAVTDHKAEPVDQCWARMFDDLDERQHDRLVVDLRWNGGGNTFLTVPMLHRLIGHQRINRRGHLFVIVGRGTFSAAQNFATMLDRHTNAVFVGEPTGSSPNFVGEQVPFELPYSKLRANVSDLYWQTSWPLDHRAWIAPELYAPPTFDAFAAQRDPAMEAILGCLQHLPGW